MNNLEPKFVRFEDKIWYIDLSTFGEQNGGATVSIVLPDGTMRPATGEDGPLMEVMFNGMTIPDPRIK